MMIRLTIKSIHKGWLDHPHISFALVEPIQINPNGMTATSSVVKSTTSNGFLTQELQISRSTTSLVIGFLILQTLTVQEKTKPNLKQLQLIRPTTQPTPLQIQLSPDSMTTPKPQSTSTSWAKKCQSKKVEQEIHPAEQSKVPKLSSWTTSSMPWQVVKESTLITLSHALLSVVSGNKNVVQLWKWQTEERTHRLCTIASTMQLPRQMLIWALTITISA